MGGTGFLVLENGTVYEGVYFGARNRALGEDEDIVQIRDINWVIQLKR